MTTLIKDNIDLVVFFAIFFGIVLILYLVAGWCMNKSIERFNGTELEKFREKLDKKYPPKHK